MNIESRKLFIEGDTVYVKIPRGGSCYHDVYPVMNQGIFAECMKRWADSSPDTATSASSRDLAQKAAVSLSIKDHFGYTEKGYPYFEGSDGRVYAPEAGMCLEELIRDELHKLNPDNFVLSVLQLSIALLKDVCRATKEIDKAIEMYGSNKDSYSVGLRNGLRIAKAIKIPGYKPDYEKNPELTAGRSAEMGYNADKRHIYVVATAVGGLMEHPDFEYTDKEVIHADSEEEALAKYESMHDCSYFSPAIMEKIK